MIKKSIGTCVVLLFASVACGSADEASGGNLPNTYDNSTSGAGGDTSSGSDSSGSDSSGNGNALKITSGGYTITPSGGYTYPDGSSGSGYGGEGYGGETGWGGDPNGSTGNGYGGEGYGGETGWGGDPNGSTGNGYGGDSNGSTGSGGYDPPGGMCPSLTCVTVEMKKDISFIAYTLESCSGAYCKATLFDSKWKPVWKKPEVRGQGKSCPGIPSSALKWEGLSQKKYHLCVACDDVSSPGDLTIYSKAGTTCETKTIDGDCGSCSCKWGDKKWGGKLCDGLD